MAVESRLADVEAQLQAVQQLAGLFGPSTDIPALAQTLAGFLCDVFDAAAASLVLVHPRTDELVFHTASAATGRLLNLARLRRGEGIAGWAAAHHELVNVPEARADPRFCDRLDAQTGFFTRSVLAAPLFRPGQIEGALEILNRNDGAPFDDDDERLLSVIAEHVALLAANAVLISGLEKRNRELSALLDVDRAMISENDLNELISVILRSVTQVAGCEGSSVVLVEPSGDGLRFFQAVGPAKDRLMHVRLDRGEGVVGQCIETGEPLWVPDPYADSRFEPAVDRTTGFRTKSILCQPLRVGQQTVGALELVNLPEELDPDELGGLVEAFAGMAAQALERARTYQGLASRADRTAEALQSTLGTLAAEQAKLTAMIEQMADAVIMLDTEHRIHLINRAAVELFGLPPNLQGESALAVGNIGLASVLAVPDTGEAGHELSIDVPTRRYLRVQAATVRGELDERLGRVVVCTDVTDLRDLARARSDLVSFVSHELRQPLSSMKGFAAALLSDARLSEPDHRGFVKIIDHELDRLRRIVDDLLCVAGIEAGQALEVHWRRFDLTELVANVVDGQRIYCPSHVLNFDVGEPLIVDADPDKIEQVLTNLIGNAVKYSAKGKPVEIRAAAVDDLAEVSVADQGIGIAAEDIPRLFQQFTRLTEARQRSIRGSGLGLYLCKQLVEAHGGAIRVDSQVGVGSTFVFSWPRRRTWEE